MKPAQRLGIVFAVAMLISLVGCGGQSDAPPQRCETAPATATITEAHGGGCLNLAVGGSAELRLTEGYRWSAPQVSSPAVELIAIKFLRDPGYLAWEIRAIGSGTSTISASGTCVDASCSKATIAVKVTITVSP